MFDRRFLNGVGLVLALGAPGCVSGPQGSGQKADGPETCPKSQFGALVGTDINAAILPLTLTYRVIYPGDAVTLDHAPDRLNISVSEDGIVERLSCG